MTVPQVSTKRSSFKDLPSQLQTALMTKKHLLYMTPVSDNCSAAHRATALLGSA
jgi:hypothetical protein